ncbi:MAG: AmmeMemoRadiSam system protein B [FCB group bacterium]|nr:AmmeMemoRadiSam system protein B [FCB group bacterium]
MTKNKIRRPAVADMFYPGDPDNLTWEIQKYLLAAFTAADFKPKALVAPHAGYVYSGIVAAAAYKTLERYTAEFNKVILIGPSHRVGFSGLATSSYDFYNTALGDIPVDKQLQQELEREFPFVLSFDAAHTDEHCLEVQLPFLQEVLGDFSLLPLVAGDTDPDSVARVIEYCWKYPNAVIVISSDLSHYKSYDAAVKTDTETAGTIESLAPERLAEFSACGRIPLAGLLLAARKNHLSVKRLDLRNSGDTAGDRSRVVGYGAWIFYDPDCVN